MRVVTRPTGQPPRAANAARRRSAPRAPSAALAPPPTTSSALLCSKFAAAPPDKAITAVAVVQEAADSGAGAVVATGSTDRALAVWALPACAACDAGSATPADAATASSPTRLLAATHPRGPVFAVAVDAAGAAAAETLGVGAPRALPSLYWGGGGDSVVRAAAPPGGELPFTLDAGAAGWVRCLATHPTSLALYSAVCGTVTAWDLNRAVPRAGGAASLFKSDVTALAASDGGALYAGAADGSLTRWPLVPGTGLLDAGAAAATAVTVPGAHAGRVVGAAVHPFSGALLTVSSDGGLAAWDPATLELLRRVPAAHGGAPVRAVAVGADGLVYTGGDDGVVARWRGADLAPAPGGGLLGHAAPVRALAAGAGGTLVSGDGGGSVCVWQL